MPNDIEITVNLKIPSLTVRPPLEPPRRIDNSGVRFITRVTVPSLPKPGEQLQLSADTAPIVCQVIKALWDEGLNMFIVYCHYSHRSIALDTYNALVQGSAWMERPLLA